MSRTLCIAGACVTGLLAVFFFGGWMETIAAYPGPVALFTLESLLVAGFGIASAALLRWHP